MSTSSFPWMLDQERIDMLASLLAKMEQLCDIASPGCLAAERAGGLLTDLREQTTAAGAADPYPDRPMFPRSGDAA